MLKVMTVVGTRPEIIKLSRVIAALDTHFKHTLVHTGQNFDPELNEVFFDELGIRKPDHYLNAAGNDAIETIASILVHVDRVLGLEKPDAVLFYGDTNSCLGVIAAKKRKIPIFHMEAGNRCFDQRVPEEINRKIVDHLSDINLPLSEHARRYLIAEGLPPDRTIKTGSPMKEVLEHYHQSIEASTVLSRLDLSARNYFLVSAHREENIDSDAHFGAFIETLDRLAEVFEKPIIVSTHPRTRKRLSTFQKPVNPLVQFMKPLGFLDYVHLQTRALCVLSDSGTITEESSLLGFPAVMIRDAHERPEGMDEASVLLCGLNPEKVLEAVKMAIAMAKKLPLKPIPDYDTTNVSQKMVRIILSYTDFVNRTVWQKPSR